MCKFESSQKDESGAKQADSAQAGHKSWNSVFYFINFLLSKTRLHVAIRSAQQKIYHLAFKIRKILILLTTSTLRR